jgi:hypothetical protein
MPLLAEYRAALAAYDPAALPEFGSLEGYIAGRLTLEVLRRVGAEPTRADFLAALAGIGAFDIGGFVLRYGPRDNRGSDQVFLTMIRSDGTFVRSRHGAMARRTPFRRGARGSVCRQALSRDRRRGGAHSAKNLVAWFAFVELRQHQRHHPRAHP